MHILLIEDNQTLADLFGAQLRRLKNHTLSVAGTKKDAMSAFEQENFDLIFVDMAMEGISDRGLEILQAVKSAKPTQRVGILSSNDAKEMVQNCRSSGAEFYMVKPFTFNGLKLVLEGDQEAIRQYRPNISEGPIISFIY